MARYNAETPGIWGEFTDDVNIPRKDEYIILQDGCQLFVRSWQKQNADVLLILHGLGGHGGWYVDLANELYIRGLTVYTVDHRGFGRSQGHSGHIDVYQQYVQDIVEVIAEIHQRHQSAKVYLLGHSMGGIFATYVAADYRHLLSGVIFLNPWIRDGSRLSLRTTLSILIGGLFKSRRRWHVAGGYDGMTTNHEAARMLEEDPYWVKELTATFLVQILRMRLGAMKRAESVVIPALVLQAQEDKVVIIAATHAFYETLKSKDKEWKEYPNWYHDTEFEADRVLLDDDIVRWIESH
ncbi:lysophospholipase [Dictyobacter sp. S3.2.2.5]|uniref:Lysophospholipase n=1 Tax=Dictyobacter halimunensis TaxID=3026934 RepID=A0ABQ6FP79_9CHLR|nr:lysophospholipase [Dictyobacter sp. S3.2.2.5]